MTFLVERFSIVKKLQCCNGMSSSQWYTAFVPQEINLIPKKREILWFQCFFEMLYSSGLDPLTFDLNWRSDKTTNFCLCSRLERGNQFYSHAEHVTLVNRFHVAIVVIGGQNWYFFLEKKRFDNPPKENLISRDTNLSVTFWWRHRTIKIHDTSLAAKIN